MNIDALETFVILADNKNFTRTANIQFIVQSTVSSRINELERIIGQELFHRDNKNISLTSAGIAFLPYAKKILSLRKESIVKSRSAGLYTDRVTIAFESQLYNVHNLNSVVQKFYRDNTDIAIKLIIEKSEILLELMSTGLIDICFISSQPKLINYSCELVAEDKIGLYVSSSSIFDCKTELTNEELADIPLLYCDLGTSFFDWLTNSLNMSPVVRFSCNDIPSTKDMVLTDLGFAFLPSSTVSEEVDSGLLREINIESPPPSREIYLAIKNDRGDCPSTMKFQEYLDLL